jgi:hypothetical protein
LRELSFELRRLETTHGRVEIIFFSLNFDILNDQSNRQEQEEEKIRNITSMKRKSEVTKLNLDIERARKKTQTHAYSLARMQCCSALSIDDVIRQHRWI